jgi:hypothetical protein
MIWFLNINQEYKINVINDLISTLQHDVVVFGNNNPKIMNNNFNKINYRNIYIEMRAVDSKVNFRNIPNDISDLLDHCYKKYYNFDLMCENFQVNDGDFTSINRQELFVLLIHKYAIELKGSNVKLIYCSDVPHNIYDYIIFLICEFRRIDFYIMRPTLLNYSALLKNSMNIDSIEEIKVDPVFPVDLNCKIDISYMNWQYRILNNNFIIQNIKIIIASIKSNLLVNGLNAYTSKSSLMYSMKVLSKRGSDTSLNIFIKIKYKLISNISKYYKRKKYNNFYSEKVDYTKQFVTIFLNYQPEATTMPLADYNANQLNMILKIAAIFSNSDVNIYVKEHPSQFVSSFHSDTCRSYRFYDIIRENSVKILSINYSSDLLLKNSKCIVVSNGTVGIQALLEGTNVIYFGDVWYKNYPNAINGNLSINEIRKHLATDAVDAKEVCEYHKSLFSKFILGDFHLPPPTCYINNYKKSFNQIVNSLINKLLNKYDS